MSSAPPPDAEPEALRNRRLRRADWRFLLPARRVRRALCPPSGALADATRVVADECVTARVSGACDLAVSADPDRAALQTMYHGLRPGGWCYTEWSRPASRRPVVVHRQLGEAGFREIACYWPRPAVDTRWTGLWAPLGAPAALQYVLQHGAGRGAARGLVRRWAWKLGPALGLVSPLVAVARRPGPDNADDLLSAIRAHWSRWGLGQRPERLSWLLLSPGRRSENKLVGLAFAEPTSRAVAVKMTRTPETDARVLNEATVLTVLGADHPQVSGAPRVLSLRRDDGGIDVVETALAGRSMLGAMRAADAGRLPALGADWLATLAIATRRERSGEDLERLVTGFVERFGPVIDRELLQAAMALPARLSRVDRVVEHRDFAPWNLLLGPGGALGVLDWESSTLSGLPAVDLVYFLAYVRFVLDGAESTDRRRVSYRASRAATEISVYAQRLGLDPGALPALRLLTWLIHTASDYRRLAEDTGTRPDPARLRASLFLALFDEELRAQRA